jgi:predicted small lipoprotein YifL
MRNPISSTVILLLSLAFLSACGQKGPLFLPGNPSTLQSIPTAEQMQQEIAAEDDENDDDDEKTTIPR